MVQAGVAQKALDDAAAEIEGYLVGRYALPLSPVPAILRVHACTIAHYRLLGSAVDDATREDYKAVRQYLERVADGLVRVVHPGRDYAAVLFGGSGTAAVEAAVASTVSEGTGRHVAPSSACVAVDTPRVGVPKTALRSSGCGSCA